MVANAIKSQSQKEVEDLWENILQTAVQAKSSHVSQPYLSLLEVARQKAELDPNDAKQYFEDKLSNLPEQFTKKVFL
ncbi:MAG: hypothetical protein HWD61_15775 [Parachlamydiaceae bacterium]|nr:MAG: hypothetical protein HWD61_15775 [Parachlamydiaceae bacterium]